MGDKHKEISLEEGINLINTMDIDVVRNKFINSIENLISSIARKYHNYNRHIDYDDIECAGKMGAIFAADKYILNIVGGKENVSKFSSYAYFWVRKCVLEEIKIWNGILSSKVREKDDLWGHQVIRVDDSTKFEDMVGGEEYESFEYEQLFTRLDSEMFNGINSDDKQMVLLYYNFFGKSTLKDLGDLYDKSPQLILYNIKSTLSRIRKNIGSSTNDFSIFFELINKIDTSKHWTF